MELFILPVEGPQAEKFRDGPRPLVHGGAALSQLPLECSSATARFNYTAISCPIFKG